MTSQDHYRILELPRDATPEEIRAAYRKAARRLHPDLNPGDEKAAEQFLLVQRAYEVLSSAAERAKYDAALPSEIEDVDFAVVYSRPVLPAIPEAQLVYALLTFAAPPAARNLPPPPLNLCLVIDRSTSMGGRRMDVVKSTTIELLRQLRPEDRLSIITFNDRAQVILSGAQAGHYQQIESDIHMMRAGGGTEIYRGLEAGYKEVLRYATPRHINHIILITDGRTYGDEERSILLAHQARRRNIGISGLGIGDEWNDAFLDKLATTTGGSTMFVERSDRIKSFLDEKFNALSQAYAHQVKYRYSNGEGTQLRYAFRLRPDVMPIEQEGNTLLLGQIPVDGSLQVLMEFLAHPIVQGQRRVYLAQGQISMEIPLRPDPQVVAPLRLSRKIGESGLTTAPPKDIIQALAQITLYRLQHRVQEDIAAGNIEDATRRLQNLATHLLAQGQSQLARTVLKEANRLQHTQSLSAKGQKHIKYGTRSLLLPAKIEDSTP